MTILTFSDLVSQAVSSADFGVASARKRGRNPAFPYIPIIERHDGTTYNPVRGLAYATRDEAIDAAQQYIDGERRNLKQLLVTPRYRALRAQYGLPREVPA